MMGVLKALRIAGNLGKGFTREWASWARQNPNDAVLQLRLWGQFLEHRKRVLRGRRWAFRKQHRLNRLTSAVQALHQLADEINTEGGTRCERLHTAPEKEW